MSEHVSVSVVIPVFNDHGRLQKCLDALLNQTYPLHQIQIIVCDNNSTDDIDTLKERYAQVTFVHEQQRGSAAARNKAIEYARGGIIAFTDSDCVPQPDWIQSAVSYLSANQEVHALGGQIITRPSSDYPAAMEHYDMLVNFRQQLYIEKYRFSATANMIVRTDVFKKVGDFDSTNFGFYGGEDCDWGLRFHDLGYSMTYAENVIVVHPAQKSILSFMHKYANIVKAHVLLARKHRELSQSKELIAKRVFSENSRLHQISKASSRISFFCFVQLLSIYTLECFIHVLVKTKMKLHL